MTFPLVKYDREYFNDKHALYDQGGVDGLDKDVFLDCLIAKQTIMVDS